MNYESPYPHTAFSKALLTGLFGGLMATLICLLYGFIFRFNTGFTMSTIINVPSIIIVCHLLMVICGMLYHAFRQAFKSAAPFIFAVLFALLALFCVWKTQGVERSPIHLLTIQFRELLTGMIIIIGAVASLGIPLLFANKKFEQAVL